MIQSGEPGAGTVLIVDDDRDIAEVVRALLIDEGLTVSVMRSNDTNAIRTAVNQLEPDCVLLDGETPGGYGRSWEEAAWMASRARRVPVIMFSAGGQDIAEAQRRETERAIAASFAGVVGKPFDLDDLATAVHKAIGTSERFDGSTAGESRRTAAMVARAEELGARDIHASTRREWLSFRTADSTLVQVYYWQRDGVYYVLRHAESGGAVENLGHFYDLETALLVAIQVRHDGEPSVLEGDRTVEGTAR